MQQKDPSDMVARFAVNGTYLGSENFGSGLINETWRCTFTQGGEVRGYILQRINTRVFRRPDQVMENIAAVTGHIAAKLRSRGIADPSTVTPALVPAKDGSTHQHDGLGGFWRMFHFIEDGEVFDTVRDRRHAYEVGRGLGMFQELVSDLPADRLYDTLPGFHLTPRYLNEYDEALRLDVKARVGEVRTETDFAGRRRELAHVLTRAIDARAVPLRVVHNDPKVNNIMIDRRTGRALCMLDLDTVKSGIVHFDFGDCIRSAANPGGEDADLKDTRFDLELFKAVAEGYLREASVFLTNEELDLLPSSVKVITFELGLRFLADHLRGDTYFKVKYPGHNLRRARVQFRLLESMEQQEQDMVAFIREHSKKRV